MKFASEKRQGNFMTDKANPPLNGRKVKNGERATEFCGYVKEHHFHISFYVSEFIEGFEEAI